METGSCLISQWFWAAQRMVELVSCGLRCPRWAKGLLQPRFEEDERRAMKFPWYLKDLRCMWLVLPFFCSFGTGFPCPQHWRSASDGLGRGFTRRVELLGQVRGPVWAQSRHFPSSTSTRACSTSLSSFEFVGSRVLGAPRTAGPLSNCSWRAVCCLRCTKIGRFAPGVVGLRRRFATNPSQKNGGRGS